MTRGRGATPPWLRLAAPDRAWEPTGPTAGGDADPPTGDISRPGVTRPEPAAVRRADKVFDALARRRPLPPGEAGDPALRLLADLVADVDADAPDREPEGAEPPREEWTPRGRGRRRGSRTIVALGMASVVLGSTGVAAAGNGFVDRLVPGTSAEEREDGAYEKSRSDLKAARDAADKGEYEDARSSLDRARRDRNRLDGDRAINLDKQIRDMDVRLGAGDRGSPEPRASRDGRPTRPPATRPGTRPGTGVAEEPGKEPDSSPGPTGTPTPSAPESGGGSDEVDTRKHRIAERVRDRVDRPHDDRTGGD